MTTDTQPQAEKLEIEPCPCCGATMEYAPTLSNRRAKCFTHRDAEHICVLRNIVLWDTDPERIAAWNRRPPPAPKPSGVEGWLIERGGQYYFPKWTDFEVRNAVQGDLWRENWTADHDRAMRFSRQQDADAEIRRAGWQNAKAVEHQWLSPIPQAASDPGAGRELAALVKELGEAVGSEFGGQRNFKLSSHEVQLIVHALSASPSPPTANAGLCTPERARASSPAEVEPSAGETAWLIEETWSGYVHYVHRDYDAQRWERECREDRERPRGASTRRTVPLNTRNVEEAMRWPTRADAEKWKGEQQRWMRDGDQFQVREHMWPSPSPTSQPPLHHDKTPPEAQGGER